MSPSTFKVGDLAKYLSSLSRSLDPISEMRSIRSPPTTRTYNMAEEIAVGIEFKFLIPFLPCGGGSEEKRGAGPAGPPIRETVHVLDAQKIQVSEKKALWRDTFAGVVNVIKGVPGQDAISCNELEKQQARERDFWATKWIVKDSKSAEPGKDHPESKNYAWVPVEINSPKMPWSDPRTLQTIEAVVKAVRTTYHVVANYSCEFHVHVGRMDGRPFTLPAMKRMAILLWFAEPIMRKVKDPRSPNFDHTYTWSFAQREHSRLSRTIANSPKLYTRNMLDGMEPALVSYLQRQDAAFPEHQRAIGHIWGALTHRELGRLMSGTDKPHRRLGYNFSAMGEEDERACTNPKTLECRFLEGVADEKVIGGWIRAFVAMVQTGLDGQYAQRRFANTVLRLINEADLPISRAFGRLMEDLGIEEKDYRPVQAFIEGIYR